MSSRLRRSALRGKHDVRWPEFLGSLTALGFDVQCLSEWCPEPVDIQRLNEIQVTLGQVLDPRHPRRDQPRRKLEEMQRSPEPVWAVLATIAGAAEPRRKGAAGAAASRRGAARPSAEDMLQQRTAAARAQAADKLQRLESRTQILASGPFATKSSRLRIYIDEAWPADRSVGILAGVVWAEPNIQTSLLPPISTHMLRGISRRAGYAARVERRVARACAALEAMISCRACFPVVMPLVCRDANAQKHYKQLATHGLLLMLGWLIRCAATNVKVEIFFERHAGFASGADETQRFRGLVEGLNLAGSPRFQHLNIEKVMWSEKDFEYIPYADLLAYLALDATEHARRVAAAVHLTSWPGYLPVSIELTSRLLRLDELESNRAVAEVLDVCSAIAGTRLGELVENDLRLRFEVHRALRLSLLRELERRCRSGAADNDELLRQVAVVQRLLPTSTCRRSTRLRALLARLQPTVPLARPAAAESTAVARRDEWSQLPLPLSLD